MAKHWRNGGFPNHDMYTSIFNKNYASGFMAYTGGSQQPPTTPVENASQANNDSEQENSEDNGLNMEFGVGLKDTVKQRSGNSIGASSRISKNRRKLNKSSTDAIMCEAMLSVANSLSSKGTSSQSISETTNGPKEVDLVHSAMDSMGMDQDPDLYLDALDWFHSNPGYCSTWLKLSDTNRHRFLQRKLRPQNQSPTN